MGADNLGQRWVVIGGADRDGIVVRVGKSTSSALEAERLSTSAVVRQLDLEGERLHYERLTGFGPAFGWVSIKLKDKELLVKAEAVWKVLSISPDSAGILVRTGKNLDCPEESERLSVGALVREIELEGNRFRYKRLAGTGPVSGWVSVRLKERELLRNMATTSPEEPPSVGPLPTGAGGAEAKAGMDSEALPRTPPVRRFEPITGRTPRILAIHGAPANGAFMKFQTAQLRNALGMKAFDWIYLDGLFPWEPMEVSTSAEWETYTRPRTELEKRIAQGRPLVVWIRLVFDEHGLPGTDFDSLTKSRDHIMQYIEEHGPVDAIVTFSQAANLSVAIMRSMTKRGKTIPWRLNVFFNPPGVVSSYDDFTEPLALRTITVHGAKDPWGYVKPLFPALFSDLLQLDHDDGHEFPITEPTASALYRRVADEIRNCCGIP